MKKEISELKSEKVFLVDHIKFMQNLIKKENLILVKENKTDVNSSNNDSTISVNSTNSTLSNKNINFDKEKDKNFPCGKNDIEKNEIDKGEGNNVYLNGKVQKKIGKVFSIFIICLLNVTYFSYSDLNNNNGETISFNPSSSIKLNEYVSENGDSNSNSFFSFVNYLNVIVIILLISLYFPIYLIIIWVIKMLRRIIKGTNLKEKKTYKYDNKIK